MESLVPILIFYGCYLRMVIHPTWILLILPTYVMCDSTKRSVLLQLPKYLQSNDVDNHHYYAAYNDTMSCTRDCVENESRVCYYQFTVENYAILTQACGSCLQNEDDCNLPQCIAGDGYEKAIIATNRMLPGPGIQVCYGDRIIVDVRNLMLARSLGIHWHGMVQDGTNHMDGVPFVTQCPIDDFASYRYAFIADTVGTHYYHSHSGVQKLNGLQGSLIIRQPKKHDPHSGLYDYDLPAHILFIMDWTHASAETRIPGLKHREATQDTTFYLINGKGRYTNENGTRIKTPYQVFQVKQGKRYRFRVIGAVCTQCPARVNIEGHTLLVIAADGVPVKPVRVDSIEIYSGERYDFVLEATKDIKSYWIQVRGMHHCFKKDVCQVAILKYQGSSLKEPLTPFPSLDRFSWAGTVLNPQNASCGWKQNAVCVTQLSSLRKIPDELKKPEPDHNIEYQFGFSKADIPEEFYKGKYNRYLQTARDRTVLLWVNNIQFLSPSAPLRTQYKDNPKHIFCPNGTDGSARCPKGTKEVCACVPILRIPLGAVVQFVLIDKSFERGLNHPFHMHGVTFNVLSMGYLPKHLMNAKDINELLKRKELPTSTAPIYKDTIAVPSAGYVVLRFIAKNPGFWFFHCHFVYHHAAGMATVIQIGDMKEYPPIPKNMPKCGDFLPPVRRRARRERTKLSRPKKKPKRAGRSASFYFVKVKH